MLARIGTTIGIALVILVFYSVGKLICEMIVDYFKSKRVKKVGEGSGVIKN